MRSRLVEENSPNVERTRAGILALKRLLCAKKALPKSVGANLPSRSVAVTIRFPLGSKCVSCEPRCSSVLRSK